MHVEITNWDKYNPRKDVERPTWFRLENNFWFDPAISKLEATGKLTWICLLAMASQQHSNCIAIDLQLICTITRARRAKVIRFLESLESEGKIKISRNADVTSTSRPRHVDVSTYERTYTKTKTKPKTATDSDESAPRNLPVKIVSSEPVGADVWTAYRAAYFAKYGVEPVRNAKANTLCKQLVQRLGGDGAVSVVKFFLTHRQAYYVTRLHPLSACVADAEALHTQMLSNHRVSSAEARENDKSQANEQTFAIVAARMEARRAGKEVSDESE